MRSNRGEGGYRFPLPPKENMKKIAGLTIVRDDPLLPKWLTYYRDHFDHIVVLDQSSRQSASLICQLADVEYVHLTAHTTGQNLWRWNIFKVNEKRGELFGKYDMVFFSDADEFVLPDPDKYSDLRSYMEQMDERFIYSMGMDVVGPMGTPIDWKLPIMPQLDLWMQYDLFGKPHMGNVYYNLCEGAHHVAGKRREPQYVDPDLYTLHLKFVDIQMSVHRNRISYPKVSETDVIRKMEERREQGKPIPDRFKESGI
jgi:hypothetical protein